MLLKGDVDRALILEAVLQTWPRRIPEDEVAEVATVTANPAVIQRHLRALVRRKYIRDVGYVPTHYEVRRDVLTRALEALGYSLLEYLDPYCSSTNGVGFTAADIAELHRLRGVARAWSEVRARYLFSGGGLGGEDYEDLRGDLESEYLRSDGDERRAEDLAWNRIFNAIDWDRHPVIGDRFLRRENRQARERGEDPPWIEPPPEQTSEPTADK